MSSILLLFCLFSTIYGINETPSAFGGRIKHVIALMFENRSFDHFLGHLKLNNSKIDGCLPDDARCQCPMNSSDPNSEMISVGFNAYNNMPGGPGHNLVDTAQQLYGILDWNANNKTYPAPMNGFVENFVKFDTLSGDNGKNIMQQQNFSSLPILSTLALEYAVFNAWHSDVPGPTDPNRMYAFMATSQGMGDDNVTRLEKGFIGNSIFKMIDEYYPFGNVSVKEKWRSFWQDAPTSVYVEYVRKHPENGGFMDDFYELCKNGNLPLFTWLDPAYQNRPNNAATDQGPPHSVLRGEEFLKNVYEAIRSSPAWNETLFLVFFDEHGGLFDHVTPPFAPNPDGINATKYTDTPFDFGRVGIRIPAVLISPWIKKGTLVPAGQQNQYLNASQYTHSSLIHTLREQYASNCPPFTKRDEWSLTFEHVVMELDKPRTDCLENFNHIDLDGMIKMDEANNNINQDMENCDCTHFCPHRSGMAHAISSLCNKQHLVEDVLKNGPDVYMPWLINCTNQWYYSAASNS